LFAFETVGSTEMLVNIVGALSDNGLGFCKDESKFIKLDNPDNHPLWGSRPHIPLLVVVARKNLPVLTPMELVDWLGSMNPEDMAEGLVPDAVLASGREVVGKAVILPKEGELNSARCVEIRGSETDCWVLLTSSDGPGAFEHERGTKARNKLIKRWQTILDDALKQGYEVTRDF
jgi:hypothetical protein